MAMQPSSPDLSHDATAKKEDEEKGHVNFPHNSAMEREDTEDGSLADFTDKEGIDTQFPIPGV
jgi:hypothetical protein